MEYKFFKPFESPKEPVFPDYSVSIKDFGAKEAVFSGDSINKAIAHVSEQGGGKVIIPSGKMENIYMKNIKINAYQCMTSDSITNSNMENVSLKQIEKA